MLHVLTHDILPVFAILALGFAMGLAGLFSDDEARAVNRVAFLVLQPPLIFQLLTGVDFAAFEWGALGIYALCEAVCFAATYLIARHLLRRDHLESWLLAMAVVFVNSLLYVGSIARLIYGVEGALPVTAIVCLDASISFAFFIVTMEMMAGDRAAGGAGRRIATNPVLLAICGSAALVLFGIEPPDPVVTAAGFAGAAAAPMTLFALGIVLAGHSIVPTPTVAAVSALTLVVFPLAVWTALALFLPGNAWSGQFVMNAAGPSGAMAFSLALLYKVRTDVIAPVIVWTSALSLFSLAYLA